jgi:hypothetical protein
MGEMGRAMMGSAAAAGVDRARIAAEQAVASPLLEGVNLSGAKGVLVNITAAKGKLKMKEVNEVMNTVKAFAAEDAHIIFGAVYDELMGDALRVTVVATGLGQVAAATGRKPMLEAVPVMAQATGTHDAVAFGSTPDYSHLDVPAVLRGRGQRATSNVTVEALAKANVPVGIMNAPIIPGLNHHEIPAILNAASEHGALNAGMTIVRLNGSISILFEDWLRKNFPDRFDKVWNQICSLHDGNVNDSQFGRRMRGEGNIADAIHQLFRSSKKKYFTGKSMPVYDLTKFRKGGMMSLF